jgi:hypothetical protein
LDQLRTRLPPISPATIEDRRRREIVVQHGIPLVQFRKGQREDTVMAEHLGKFRIMVAAIRDSYSIGCSSVGAPAARVSSSSATAAKL